MLGTVLGDQVAPALAVNSSGGFLVWQDPSTDGDGFGISAIRLDNTFSATPSPTARFRVNQSASGDQTQPRVALLPNGGSVIVWQGGRAGFPNVYARFINAAGVFTTANEIQVNTYTAGAQVSPVVVALSETSALVVWSSFGQDGSMQGVFGQIVTSAGQLSGSAFQINQFTNYNQRSPAAVLLGGGNIVVAWISENQRFPLPTPNNPRFSVDVFARFVSLAGQPVGNEFRLNGSDNHCANPALAPSGEGFLAVWSERKPQISSNGWDIAARAFSAAGSPVAPSVTVNTYLLGDQFAPQVAALGTSHLVVWTSVGQDGSGEGVYGQLLSAAQLSGSEFRVNTTTQAKQFHPAVSADASGHALVAWSGFTRNTGFDLFAQRYAGTVTLPQPAPPFVSALSQSRLSVTWPVLQGYSNLDHYVLVMDGSAPVNVASNMWTATGLVPSSTHSFRLGYVLADASASALSAAATGQTWGEDANGDGLPDDWQTLYWGYKSDDWPDPNADSDGDGVSNRNEFLAGTSPVDGTSFLRVHIARAQRGALLEWNSQPGFIYQVQAATAFGQWANVGGPRFAAGTTDSISISPQQRATFYRVIRLR